MPIIDRVRYNNVEIELYHDDSAGFYYWLKSDGEKSQTFRSVYQALSAKNKRILIWKGNHCMLKTESM